MGRLTPRKQLDVGVLPFGANTTIPGGNTVANTAVETAFSSSIVVPAGGFKTGDFITVTARGLYSTATLTPSLRLRLKLGSTVLADTGALSGLLGGANNAGWTLVADLLFLGTGSQAPLEVQGRCDLTASATAVTTVFFANTASIPVDQTQTQALTISVLWGTAAAANSIQLRQFLGRYD